MLKIRIQKTWEIQNSQRAKAGQQQGRRSEEDSSLTNNDQREIAGPSHHLDVAHTENPDAEQENNFLQC